MVSHGVQHQQFSGCGGFKGCIDIAEHRPVPTDAVVAVCGITGDGGFHGVGAGALAAGLIVDPADGDARAVDDGEDAFFGEDTVAVIVLAAHAAEHAGETHVG